MSLIRLPVALILLSLLVNGCHESSNQTNLPMTDSVSAKGSYAYDAAFLKKHTQKVVELHDSAGKARVLLSADYQARVMTSTAMGDSGNSYGWMNYALIAAGEKKKQFNPFGGEERFWLGPEGGQYAIYFPQGKPFDISHWQIPAIIDTLPYELIHAENTWAEFAASANLINYSGSSFHIGIKRKISLLDKKRLEERLHTILPADLEFVAYESENAIINQGSEAWKKESGLLSIWLLGMMTPTEETKVMVPFLPGPDARSHITDNYFGKIASDRMLVKDSVIYLRCDGKSRGKLGISPLIAKPIVGSMDFRKNILTILIPEVDKQGLYVNSKWELQKEPYKGDVINAYNDGPLADGSQLGPFYEIESSSAARELKPGETQTYRQCTCHFQGRYEDLKALAEKILGVNLEEVKKW